MGRLNAWIRAGCLILFTMLATGSAFASEADLKIPPLDQIKFGGLSGLTILHVGLVICVLGAAFGWMIYIQTKNLPVHTRMASVSNIIWETCKTYLLTQGKFLVVLW